MTPEELMGLVGVATRTTLWRWDRMGIGPTRYAIDRRTTRYSRSEVRTWLLAGAKRIPRDSAQQDQAAPARASRKSTTSKKGGDAHAAGS